MQEKNKEIGKCEFKLRIERLSERRKLAKIIPGIDAHSLASILFVASKIKRSNTEIYKLNKKLNFNPRHIQTGRLNSNILLSVINDNQKYRNRGIIGENYIKYS